MLSGMALILPSSVLPKAPSPKLPPGEYSAQITLVANVDGPIKGKKIDYIIFDDPYKDVPDTPKLRRGLKNWYSRLQQIHYQ